MARFITIGERIHCISPTIKKAMEEMNPEPILKRAKEQIAAGATYLDVNIGPAEKNGVELMQWAVQLIQGECNNIPLCLDTANLKAIEAGIQVYNRANGKPIVNSADHRLATNVLQRFARQTGGRIPRRNNANCFHDLNLTFYQTIRSDGREYFRKILVRPPEILPRRK